MKSSRRSFDYVYRKNAANSAQEDNSVLMRTSELERWFLGAARAFYVPAGTEGSAPCVLASTITASN
jgi:hypothetical protein